MEQKEITDQTLTARIGILERIKDQTNNFKKPQSFYINIRELVFEGFQLYMLYGTSDLTITTIVKIGDDPALDIRLTINPDTGEIISAEYKVEPVGEEAQRVKDQIDSIRAPLKYEDPIFRTMWELFEGPEEIEEFWEDVKDPMDFIGVGKQEFEGSMLNQLLLRYQSKL